MIVFPTGIREVVTTTEAHGIATTTEVKVETVITVETRETAITVETRETVIATEVMVEIDATSRTPQEWIAKSTTRSPSNSPRKVFGFTDRTAIKIDQALWLHGQQVSAPEPSGSKLSRLLCTIQVKNVIGRLDGRHVGTVHALCSLHTACFTCKKS